MTNPTNPSKEPLKGGDSSPGSGFFPAWIKIDVIVKDAGFFVAGIVGALIVGWIIFPMVLYSKHPNRSILTTPCIWIPK